MKHHTLFSTRDSNPRKLSADMAKTSITPDLIGSLALLSLKELIHQEPPANTATSFHNFKELPPELRRHIWEAMLPDPRAMECQLRELKSREDEDKYTISTQPTQALWTAREIPEALFVCNESYDVFSKHYTHTFHRFRSIRSFPGGTSTSSETHSSCTTKPSPNLTKRSHSLFGIFLLRMILPGSRILQ